MDRTGLFLAGIVMVVLGSLVVIFDYPQIQYLEDRGAESRMLPGSEEREVHQRLIIESVIGAGILVAGIVLTAASWVRGFQDRFRQG